MVVPLTLTTIRGLLIACKGHVFAVPSSHVERLVRVNPSELKSIEGRPALLLNDTPVPVVALADVLALESGETAQQSEMLTILVLARADQHLAVLVDGLIAEQELIIKNLGTRLLRIKKISGATVLPTGKIALILDTAELIRSALIHAPIYRASTMTAQIPAGAPKRLIVADDSVTTRTLEKTILEAAGYEVTAAADGAEAWQLLQERGADLVVSDVEMPRMDGFALTEAIRGSKRFRDLPVILVTGLEKDEDRARGMEIGADAYLLKSAFDQRNLLETISQLL
jgi:two-component system chemotaxis sensor kinase CheA